jgi:hypothetical protein
MNDAQLRKYRVEWNKARQALRAANVSPKDADARRHELHVEALGEDKSSTDLTNGELDLILAAFRAISQPGNFTTQMEQAEMPATRKRFGIVRLLAALGKDQGHVDQLIESRREAGRLVTVIGDAAASFETIGEEDLQRLMLDLKKECQKRWRRKGDLLSEVRLLRMEFEYDEASTAAAVRTALKVKALELHDLSYDQLLVVIATMRDITRRATESRPRHKLTCFNGRLHPAWVCTCGLSPAPAATDPDLDV